MDSNHRRRKPADLQSAPFVHSGICPCSQATNYAVLRIRGLLAGAKVDIIPYLQNFSLVFFNYSSFFAFDFNQSAAWAEKNWMHQ